MRRLLRPASWRRDAAWILAAALALAACRTREAAAPPKPPPPPVLVVASGSDLSGVNELAVSATRQFDQDVLSQMFLKLLAEQPDFETHPPTFAPELAKSWEASADRLALTFHLRDDVAWSDGVPVTADDVRFTWQAQTSAAVGWPNSYLKESIRDVEVVDPHTVRFHFTRAYATQLLDANDGFVLPAHVWKQLPFEKWPQSGDWFRDHLVVDGPYALERWQPQQEVALRANPRYFEKGKPKIAQVIFRIVPDETARIAELLGGGVGLVEGIPADRADEVTKTPGRTVRSVWQRQYTAIVWNTRRAPLDDPVVRRALTLAIDRPSLVESLWKGRARIGDSPILSNVWLHPADLHPWPYDPAQAKQLLASRGFADTDGDGVLDRKGKPFAIELSTNTNQLRRDAVVLIQDQLKRVGVEVTPAFRESGAQSAKLAGHEFDGAVIAWGMPTDFDLRYAFDSRDPDETNWGRYKNAEVDRLLDEIDKQPDRASAKPLFERAQHLIHEDQPYTFLWEPPRLVGLDARLRATPSALSTFTGLASWDYAATP
jgi:peptide/nickel transport system substrate-binding protein